MTIQEYDFLQCKDQNGSHFIGPHTFAHLERFVLENEHANYLKLTVKKGFGKVLQAQNYVGVIQTHEGVTIEIVPKIAKVTTEEGAKTILIKMLKTLKNSPFKNFSTAHLKSAKMPLLEVFIGMFLEELSKLVRQGIKSDYMPREENLRFLKGKLDIGGQIKHNTIHKERFFVAYEEYSSDRVENRLIKTTLEYLYTKSKTHANQQRIREFLFVFEGVEVSHAIENDFNRVKPERQMKSYEQVLLWCKTFLLQNSFSPYKGDEVAFALLFDMNLLFESYVYDYLKKHGRFEHISAQEKKHHLAFLAGKGKFRLKPDIVIRHESETVIADTKWKILRSDKRENGISQSDIYQLYAYGTKYEGCQKVYLIYPKTEEIEQNRYDYFQEGKKLSLEVVFFDVASFRFSKNIDFIESKLEQLSF